MKKYIISGFTTILLFIGYQTLYAQGCVAVRHFSSCGSTTGGSQVFLRPGEWALNANYRYFRSFRHFRGTHEEPQRVANNTEVINWQHAMNISVSYPIVSRLTANMTIPLVYNERSSLYEHGNVDRHKSIAYGLGDTRLSANYWLLDPYKHRRSAIIVGLGVRFPTGNASAEDRFYNVGENGVAEMRDVDQSIQPGDGGFGFTTELQVSHQITNNIGVFAGGFYLFNPREKNSTRTYRDVWSHLRENEAYMSVADQYAFQGGAIVGLPLDRWSLSLGGRYEGVPVEDVLGGSDGFRRPGYIWSVDPGLTYTGNNFSISLNIPVAVDRARPQSVTEREIEEMTGETTVGDAAFADYLINLDIVWNFGEPKNELRIF